VLIVVTDPHATLRENVCARLRPECQISRHSAPGSTQHPVGPCGSRCQQAGSTVCAAARPAPGRWRYPRVRDVDPADVVVDAPRWCAKMHQTLSV